MGGVVSRRKRKPETPSFHIPADGGIQCSAIPSDDHVDFAADNEFGTASRITESKIGDVIPHIEKETIIEIDCDHGSDQSALPDTCSSISGKNLTSQNFQTAVNDDPFPQVHDNPSTTMCTAKGVPSCLVCDDEDNQNFIDAVSPMQHDLFSSVFQHRQSETFKTISDTEEAENDSEDGQSQENAIDTEKAENDSEDGQSQENAIDKPDSHKSIDLPQEPWEQPELNSQIDGDTDPTRISSGVEVRLVDTAVKPTIDSHAATSGKEVCEQTCDSAEETPSVRNIVDGSTGSAAGGSNGGQCARRSVMEVAVAWRMSPPPVSSQRPDGDEQDEEAAVAAIDAEWWRDAVRRAAARDARLGRLSLCGCPADATGESSARGPAGCGAAWRPGPYSVAVPVCFCASRAGATSAAADAATGDSVDAGAGGLPRGDLRAVVVATAAPDTARRAPRALALPLSLLRALSLPHSLPIAVAVQCSHCHRLAAVRRPPRTDARMIALRAAMPASRLGGTGRERWEGGGVLPIIVPSSMCGRGSPCAGAGHPDALRGSRARHRPRCGSAAATMRRVAGRVRLGEGGGGGVGS